MFKIPAKSRSQVYERDIINATTPNSSAYNRARKIVLLNDALHICLLRNDNDRAARILSILVQCKEIAYGETWEIALTILKRQGKDIDSILTPMQSAGNKERILIDLTLDKIQRGNYQDALDDLNDNLTILPYLDSATLHVYAAMLTLQLLSQEANAAKRGKEDASRLLVRGIALGKDTTTGTLASSLLNQVCTMVFFYSYLRSS